MKLNKTEIKLAVDAFKAVTVVHSHQEDALQLVLFMLELSPNCAIVNLVGPTGVGKSLLQARVVSTVLEDEREAMQRDPDYVPIIRTHALASGHRQFDWKSLYRGALTAVGDPFAANRRALSNAAEATWRSVHTGESRTAAELRASLEYEFKKRGTKVWIIDEAQHLVFGGRSGRAGDQFDVLKSIAQNADVKLVLAGPHEMEAGLASSGQLARRSATVHLRRYKGDEAHQLRMFAKVVKTLVSHMKVQGFPSITENIGFFHSGCAGCIGIMKDWLAKAYGLALRGQSETEPAMLTLNHLRETRLAIDAMTSIVNDIRLEEEDLARTSSDQDFENLVARVPRSSTNRRLPSSNASSEATGTPSHAGRRLGRVGIRSPAPRDPVPTLETAAYGSKV